MKAKHYLNYAIHFILPKLKKKSQNFFITKDGTKVETEQRNKERFKGTQQLA